MSDIGITSEDVYTKVKKRPTQSFEEDVDLALEDIKVPSPPEMEINRPIEIDLSLEEVERYWTDETQMKAFDKDLQQTVGQMSSQAKQTYEYFVSKQAETFLNKFYNVLNAPNVAVGGVTGAIELAKKDFIKDMAQQKKMGLSQKNYSAIMEASDDDIAIVYPKKSAASSFYLPDPEARIKIEIAQPPILKQPQKEEKPFAQKPWWDVGREGPSVGTKTIQTNIKVKDIDNYLGQKMPNGKARWKNIIGESLKASLESLKTRNIYFKREGEGKYRVDVTSGLMEQAVKGTTKSKLAGATGFIADITIPGTGEVIPARLLFRGSIKALKKIPTFTKLGKATRRAPGLRELSIWFNVEDPELKLVKNITGQEKVYQGARKVKISRMADDIVDVFKRAAKKEGKKFNANILQKEMDRWQKWLTEKHGFDEIRKMYREVGTIDPLLTDPAKMAKRLGMKESVVRKYIGIQDMRLLGDALETGVTKGAFSEDAAKAMRKAIDHLEQIKIDAGLLTSKKAQRVGYMHRASIYERSVPSTPFRYTPIKPSSLKKRLKEVWKHTERAMLESAEGNIYDYNVFRVFLEDAENTLNHVLQLNTEKLMVKGGAAKRIIVSPKLAKATKGRKQTQEIINSLKRGGEPPSQVKIHNLRYFENNLRDSTKYRVWYPINRIRFYLEDTATKIRKAMEKASGETYEGLQKTLDDLDSLWKRTGEIEPSKQASFSRIFEDYAEIFNRKVMDNVNIRNPVAISGKVPAYIVHEDVLNFILAETKSMFTPEMRKIYRFSNKVFNRVFGAMVTVYNPRFWFKFFRTDFIQWYKGGMHPSLYGVRFQQAARIMAGKGMIEINGVKVPAKALNKAGQGVKSTMRGLVKGNNYNVLSRFGYDVFERGKASRFLRKLAAKPGEFFSVLDDNMRYGLAVDYISRMAESRGIKTTEGILELMRTEGVEHVMLHMFNYADLPRLFRWMRGMAPFLSWHYHIIPDQIKFATKLDKMQRISAGKRSLQNIVGEPETPLEYEYLKESQAIKMKGPDGKLYTIDTGFPHERLLDIKTPSGYIASITKHFGPLLSLPLSIAGKKTYPKLEDYAVQDQRAEKVDVPIYFALMAQTELGKKFLSNPTVIDALGFNFRYDTENGEKVFQMNKRALDIIHNIPGIGPGLMNIHQNTKQYKLKVSGLNQDLETQKEYLKDLPTVIREMDPEDIKRDRPYRFTPVEDLKPYEAETFVPYVYKTDPSNFLWYRWRELVKYFKNPSWLKARVRYDPEDGLTVPDPKLMNDRLARFVELYQMFVDYNEHKNFWIEDLGQIEQKLRKTYEEAGLTVLGEEQLQRMQQQY